MTARRTASTRRTRASPADRPCPAGCSSGTSGFAYAGWAPRFYPAGLRAAGFLPHYAARLPAVELNNTYYASPTAAKIAAWLAATPPDFRFAVKAQRGGSFRALADDPGESVAWLTGPYRAFGERLGTVLFRVPENARRDDAKLAGAARRVARRPAADDGVPGPVLARRRDVRGAGRGRRRPVRHRAARDDEPPILRRTGSFLYLRLRRHDYSDADLDAWAARLEPFLSAGDDAFVFFRHDEVGRGAELALAFRRGRGADSALAGQRAVALGRPEHDQELEPLGDVVEAMRDARRDEHERTRHDRPRLAPDRDLARPATT